MAPEDGRDEALATDLVSYLVIEAPDRDALASLVGPLGDLVAASTIRILDVVVVEKDADGVVRALEPEDVEGLERLRDVRQPTDVVLTEQDVRLATLPLRGGAVGFVLVTEDRWAAELSNAAHVVGGRIVAGERIPPARVEHARERAGANERGG